MIASSKGNSGQLGGGRKSGRNHQNWRHKGAADAAPVFCLKPWRGERKKERWLVIFLLNTLWLEILKY